MKTLKNNIALIGVTVYFLLMSVVAISVASPKISEYCIANTPKNLSDPKNKFDESKVDKNSTIAKASYHHDQLRNYKRQGLNLTVDSPRKDAVFHRTCQVQVHSNYKHVHADAEILYKYIVLKSVLQQRASLNYKSQF